MPARVKAATRRTSRAPDRYDPGFFQDRYFQRFRRYAIETKTQLLAWREMRYDTPYWRCAMGVLRVAFDAASELKLERIHVEGADEIEASLPGTNEARDR